MTYDYDLVVIGAGSGGLAAAKRAARHKAKVAIVEQEHLGGVCVNRGCVPKKLMVYAADFARLLQAAKDYGWSVEPPQFHWSQFVQKRDQEIVRLQSVQEKALSETGATLIRGHATFKNEHVITIDQQRHLSARYILIAVGSQPVKPDIPGIEHTITSREIFHLPRLPQSLAVIGGGYVGVEFASIMRDFGVEVTLFNYKTCILPHFDPDLGQAVQDGLSQRGITSLCDTTAKSIQPTSNHQFELTLTGKHSEPLTAEVVLCATGRRPRLDLGLEQIDVQLDGKAIAVDEHYRTSQSHIFAIGDCIARLPLTPVAIAEGRVVADALFGDHQRTIDYDLIPTAVFARPEAASVGMSEEKARQTFGDDAVICSRRTFRPLFDTLLRDPMQTLIKWVMQRESGKIVGCHIVGEHAAEMIQGVALAMHKGITQADLKTAIGIHPSSAEELFS